MIRPTLIVITGPTASGKTELAISLARILKCEIISADSRQVYKHLPIGTAVPTATQLALVRHYMVSFLELDQYYSAACYEEDVMNLLADMFTRAPYAILCGGSMMYIDAVVYGIDSIPTISDKVRGDVLQLYNEHGIDAIIDELSHSDPTYLESADRSNYRRLIHAVEVCRQAGVPYSSLRTGQRKKRPFDVVKMMIDYDRQSLFERINRRVEHMIADGLVDEARAVYGMRHLNSLNTVGYKELFDCFDGKMDMDTAIARIQKNTRVYAKKQLTWLSKDGAGIVRLNPSDALIQAVEHLKTKHILATQ